MRLNSVPPIDRISILILIVCSAWLFVCVIGHVTVARWFIASAPVSSYRQLARYLEEQHIRYLVTDYVTGYHVAFLTGERVRAATDFDRVQEHRLAVYAHMRDAVEVKRITGTPCEGDVAMVAAFYVCRPKRVATERTRTAAVEATPRNGS